MVTRYRLVCMDCKVDYVPDAVHYTCDRCGGLLSVELLPFTDPMVVLDGWAKRPLSVWRYAELLPAKDRAKVVSLGEGGTPLNLCEKLSYLSGIKEVYVKNEGQNPTGSFKDRGMSVGMTKAVELGMKRVICASTGNTSASMAAYAAKAGLVPIVLMPAGKVAVGKLVQALVHGANVIQVRGNFDDALAIVRDLCLHEHIYLLNSLNPFRLEGQKTAAFEIWEQLGRQVPDYVIVPVGNAGNISAIWKGFRELRDLGFVDGCPKMIGIQAEGAAPIADAFKMGSKEVKPIKNPETVATAIRIGSPVNWKRAIVALAESAGMMESVSDEDILRAQRLLASSEGLFAEPAGAASVAGLMKLSAEGRLDKESKVVCIVTGHGLKDQAVVLQGSYRAVEVEANVESVVQAIVLPPPTGAPPS